MKEKSRTVREETVRETMGEVLALLGSGAVDAAIDTVFPLERAADALQFAKDGKVRGKVVLTTGAVR